MNTVLANSWSFQIPRNNDPRALDACELDLEAIERQDFIKAMARAVTGVNVVTTDGHAGRFGLTVSAVTSVSAEPPMLLVCINRHNPAAAAVRNNGVFCINVLSNTQSKLADRFAGRPKWGKPYDFSRVESERGTTGSPYLKDALANFDCIVERSIDAGTHTIFIGRVTSTIENEGTPLLYTNRTYGLPYLMS